MRTQFYSKAQFSYYISKLETQLNSLRNEIQEYNLSEFHNNEEPRYRSYEIEQVQKTLSLTEELAKGLSNDKHTQVGCTLLAENKNRILKPISFGANGYLRDTDKVLSSYNKEEWLNSKYPYMVHAEANAVMNMMQFAEHYDKRNMLVAVVTLFPCNNCAQLLIMAGVTKVYYSDNKYMGKDFSIAAMRLFEAAGVEVIKIKTTNK